MHIAPDYLFQETDEKIVIDLENWHQSERYGTSSFYTQATEAGYSGTGYISALTSTL